MALTLEQFLKTVKEDREKNSDHDYVDAALCKALGDEIEKHPLISPRYRLRNKSRA